MRADEITADLRQIQFYLLNYFKAGTGEQTPVTQDGRRLLGDIGCTRCHKPDLRIDKPRFPTLKRPAGKPFLVKNIFTDFKRHDLGPSFHERNYDGTTRTEFLTTPLWCAGSTSPYGHDGRSINPTEVILRHGGEARNERDKFARLDDPYQGAILDFLNSLVLFPPDDTASNLNPGNRKKEASVAERGVMAQSPELDPEKESEPWPSILKPRT